MRRKDGELVRSILSVLTDIGPTTGAEICQELNLTKSDLSAIISRMKKPQATLPKRLYIKDYVFEHETHNKRYPRAVYAIGDLEDKPKPKTSRREIVKRYNENKRKRMTGNSVFNLGLPRRIYGQSSSQSIT